jgi:hypothetical protein
VEPGFRLRSSEPQLQVLHGLRPSRAGFLTIYLFNIFCVVLAAFGGENNKIFSASAFELSTTL